MKSLLLGMILPSIFASSITQPLPVPMTQLITQALTQTIIQPNSHIEYVLMPPMPATPFAILLTIEGDDPVKDQLPGIGKKMVEFENRMSRHRILMTYATGPMGSGPQSDAHHKKLKLIPGANSHVPIIGNAVSAKHELGHEMGINHANTRIWKTQTVIGQQAHEHDPFDPMTTSPGVISYNAPHIHLLKWFTATEEAYAQDNGEYILRMINDGNEDFKSLKAIYYRVPGSAPVREIWFSYVHIAGDWKAPNGMPGTGVAIHEMNGGETYLEGLIGMDQKTEIRSGLILTLSGATDTQVTVKIKIDPNWHYEQ